MITIHLLVEEDYIEDFITTLPRDKVIVIEENFESNKKMLQNVVEDYKADKKEFVPYYDSMRGLTTWLEQRENA